MEFDFKLYLCYNLNSEKIILTERCVLCIWPPAGAKAGPETERLSRWTDLTDRRAEYVELIDIWRERRRYGITGLVAIYRWNP